jgi:hypothetical protein
MTLAELITHFRIYADDRNSDRYTDDTEPTLLLNRAQAEAQKKILAHDETYFTACIEHSIAASPNGQSEVTLPTDFSRALAVERLTSSEPVPAKWVSFGRRHLESTGEDVFVDSAMIDRPLVYLRGNKLGVARPKTGYTLRIFYNKQLTDLSDDADVSEIPLELHNWLALHAARLAILSEGQAFPLEQQYQEELADFASIIGHRQTQGTRTVHYHGD